MRKLILAVTTFLLCLMTAAGSEAATITLNFDELALGTIVDTEYTADGVTFSNSASSLVIRSDQISGTPLPAPFTAPNQVLPSDFNVPSYTQATFSVAVSSVSVLLGDFGFDADNLFLYAYDAGNNLLATDTDLLPLDTAGGLLLSVSNPNIAYVRFYGTGLDGNNNVYFDNFTFETTAVPEPATMFLIGAGVLGAGMKRFRHGR